jgi:putative oxidoreductase
MSNALNNSVTLASRILISAIFIISGLGKIAALSMVAGAMHAAGVPLVSAALPLTILLEVVGGLALLVGFRARTAATLLGAFLVVVTFVFHNFWAASGAAAQLQFIEFLKNFAILGGLLRIVADGAGPLSIDARTRIHSRLATPAHAR